MEEHTLQDKSASPRNHSLVVGANACEAKHKASIQALPKLSFYFYLAAWSDNRLKLALAENLFSFNRIN